MLELFLYSVRIKELPHVIYFHMEVMNMEIKDIIFLVTSICFVSFEDYMLIEMLFYFLAH